MDYQKIDASLGEALSEAEDTDASTLIVFIHTKRAPNDEQTAVLKSLGVHQVPAGKQIFTATISPSAVDELSQKPWVRSIKLSQKLRPSREG